ncbi:hypothetical protein C2845_PM03G11800 [Panicum miliaceum]|uniref:TFIIS N-terminal domain-containing protein n=1 Tax=Panicum miliaceum TaxID=4540 RepID=A0A3L6TAL4_PANMI|nr:hypothetical protein C2845_PM03G11800 [Panicum miliaceum]
MALRRWKPFLGAFPHIDTAIEAADADGLLSRDEIRGERARIVEMLCDAADDDDEKAEGFCVLLDEAMAASLATLRAVPSERIALASGHIVGAVGALMRDHASERVRGLARDVVRGWRAGVKAELARARAAMDNRAPVVRTNNLKPSSADTGAPAVVPVPARPKKTPPVVSCSVAVEKKMEATKRKLHERYREAEDAKRRRTIQEIRPPRPPTGQRQRNAHPAVRARAPASCA